jgi:hypothetical protein
MRLKKLFRFNTISSKNVKENQPIKNIKKTPKVKGKPIQNRSQEIPTKNKWLNQEDSFGKLERGTE